MYPEFSPEFCNWCIIHLCIINDLGGEPKNGCGQLHVRELQIHDMCSCNAEKQGKTKLVKGQLTLFGERTPASSGNIVAVMMAQ